MSENNGTTRRDFLKKAGVGAGLIAGAVFASPGMQRLAEAVAKNIPSFGDGEGGMTVMSGNRSCKPKYTCGDFGGSHSCSAKKPNNCSETFNCENPGSFKCTGTDSNKCGTFTCYDTQPYSTK